MDIAIARRGGTAVAAVSGDVTHAVSAELTGALLAALGEAECLVLDFGGIGMLTSAGLRALLLLHRQAAGGNKRLVLADVPPAVQDVMAVTGFWDQFEARATVDEAVTAVSKR